MASNSADCDRGVARLISSTRRTLVKIGPGMKRKLPPSSTLAPRMSLGRRSGVPCTREKSKPRARLKARANSVLPTPGTSSIRTCPPASRATTRRRMQSSSTTTACRIESQMARQKRSPANGLGGVLDGLEGLTGSGSTTGNGSLGAESFTRMGRQCVPIRSVGCHRRAWRQEIGVGSASSSSSLLSRRASRSACQSSPALSSDCTANPAPMRIPSMTSSGASAA